MPEFQTKHFGTLPYVEEAVVRFPLGLPGFEDEKRFLVIEQETNKPLVFLQSLTQPDLCFMTVPPHVVLPEFRLQMAPEDLQTLGLSLDRQPVPGSDVVSLAILAVEENEAPTANLLAPIVINLNSHVAVQALQVDSQLSHRHPLGNG